jgi:hypothetical protein
MTIPHLTHLYGTCTKYIQHITKKLALLLSLKNVLHFYLISHARFGTVLFCTVPGYRTSLAMYSQQF